VQVLGEHRPDALQDEIAQDVQVGGVTLPQLLVEIGDKRDRLARELRSPALEHRIAAGEEVQRVEIVREIDEIEHEPRFRVDRARLPDLETVERAQHHVPRRGRRGRARLLPVMQELSAMLWEPGDLGRPLHLDDADARPEQVHEAARSVILKPRAGRLAIDAVALEKLVQERLRLGALRTLVPAPVRRELGEATPNLVFGGRHVRPRGSAVPSEPRRGCLAAGDGRRR
jgi:hypothetical protein